jgi:hypothetical protein
MASATLTQGRLFFGLLPAVAGMLVLWSVVLVPFLPFASLVSVVGRMVVIGEAVLVAVDILRAWLAMPPHVGLVFGAGAHFVFLKTSAVLFVQKGTRLFPAVSEVLLIGMLLRTAMWALVPLLMSFFFLVMHVFSSC